MFAARTDAIQRGSYRPSARAILLAVLVLVLAVIVSGCGASAVSSSGSGTAAATATSRLTLHPGGPGASGGTAIRPCPGPYGSASDVRPAPAVVLPISAAGHTATAHSGDIIQVQLPSSLHWQYMSGQSTTAGAVSLLQPAGIEDNALELCAWNFTAQSAGTVSLVFEGVQSCDPKTPCTAKVQRLTFSVVVS